MKLASEIFENVKTNPCRGYVVFKKDTKMDGEIVESYTEFEPVLFAQHNREGFYKEFPKFNSAVDEFFSKIEIQKIDSKGLFAPIGFFIFLLLNLKFQLFNKKKQPLKN